VIKFVVADIRVHIATHQNGSARSILGIALLKRYAGNIYLLVASLKVQESRVAITRNDAFPSIGAT
jgi:hypothetical protein